MWFLTNQPRVPNKSRPRNTGTNGAHKTNQTFRTNRPYKTPKTHRSHRCYKTPKTPN